jgi:hypothetical protein
VLLLTIIQIYFGREVKYMSTLDYTISMLKTMPEDKLMEVQNYIRYIIFRDKEDVSPLTPLTEDMLVEQLTTSMKKSDMGMVTSADEVSRKMREKYGI